MAALLPPLPDIDRLIRPLQPDEIDDPGKPEDSPAWSWVEYFYNWTLNKLRRIHSEMGDD